MILLPNDKTNYPINPGIYRMLDVNEHIIYIGKAKNLKKRLTSYFNSSTKSTRIKQMVAEIKSIDITSTATENDALILEQKLINKLKPKYNIIFRDDRSYPFIALSKHKFPKIHITREKSQYFKSEHLYGPYSRREEANKNIEFVQKIFKLRTCTDNELSHRSRACMLHSIGKCSAPCMNKDSVEFVEGEAARKGEKDNLVIDLLKIIFPYNLTNLDFIDISHFGGEATYGGKIRWSLSTGVLDKKGYRLAKFDENKIDDIYHMNKTVEKIYHDETDSPSILLIDGDKPQMNAAFKALKAKGLSNKVLLMCSAKGSARIKGDEKFFIHPNSIDWVNPEYIRDDELNLAKNNVVRLFFQNLQDNAHDFSNGARRK